MKAHVAHPLPTGLCFNFHSGGGFSLPPPSPRPLSPPKVFALGQNEFLYQGTLPLKQSPALLLPWAPHSGVFLGRRSIRLSILHTVSLKVPVAWAERRTPGMILAPSARTSASDDTRLCAIEGA